VAKFVSTKTRPTALYICRQKKSTNSLTSKETKMKSSTTFALVLNLAIATAMGASVMAIAAEPAKAPAAPAAATAPATPAAPAGEMKLAKKKADKEAEKKASPKSEPAKDQKAEAPKK
jgi:hypothetical protein